MDSLQTSEEFVDTVNFLTEQIALLATMNALIMSDFFSDEVCPNGHHMSSGIKNIVRVACNIF